MRLDLRVVLVQCRDMRDRVSLFAGSRRRGNWDSPNLQETTEGQGGRGEDGQDEERPRMGRIKYR